MLKMRIFSWGSNSHGQLGQGLQVEQILEPQPILTNVCVKSIVGGGKHTLLLSEEGTMYSCGDNDQGQLSKEKALRRLLSFEKINLKFAIVKVSCGWDFNLALGSGGEVFGWGGNSFGQLGIPQEKTSTVYEPVKIFSEKAIDIACGLRHSLIVGIQGFVYSAGFGRKGQLGIPLNGAKNISFFTQVPSIKGGSKVCCGENHSVLCTTDDKIFVWGDNKFGQLGMNPKTQTQCAAPVLMPFQVGKIRAVVGGWLHNAILTDDGEVFTWGRNDYGQLAEIRQENWKPKSVEALKGVTQIVLGSNHGIALKNNGDILSWGWNEHGNCGNGSCNNIYDPVLLKTCGYTPQLIGTGSAHSFFYTN